MEMSSCHPQNKEMRRKYTVFMISVLFFSTKTVSGQSHLLFTQPSCLILYGGNIRFFSNFSEFSEKTYVITVKGFKPANFYVKDQDSTTLPPRHMRETGSLNWIQFMHHCFFRFPEFIGFTEFLFCLGKTPIRLLLLWSVILSVQFFKHVSIFVIPIRHP